MRWRRHSISTTTATTATTTTAVVVTTGAGGVVVEFAIGRWDEDINTGGQGVTHKSVVQLLRHTFIE